MTPVAIGVAAPVPRAFAVPVPRAFAAPVATAKEGIGSAVASASTNPLDKRMLWIAPE